MGNSFLNWLNKIFGGNSTTPVEIPTSKTPWIDVAKKEIGVHETKGGETARIIEYHHASTGQFDQDEVPWCASFVNWVMDQCKMARPRNENDALAATYDDYGEALAAPKIGCILTFRWSNGGRHVAFCSDFTDTQVKALGGNQTDLDFGSGGEVNEHWQSRGNVVAYRWPVK